MKKNEQKALRGKLLVAIKKVLTDSSVEQTNKTEKKITKSIKNFTKRIDIKRKGVAVKKIKKTCKSLEC